MVLGRKIDDSDSVDKPWVLPLHLILMFSNHGLRYEGPEIRCTHCWARGKLEDFISHIFISMKTPNRDSLKKRTFILAHEFRGFRPKSIGPAVSAAVNKETSR